MSCETCLTGWRTRWTPRMVQRMSWTGYGNRSNAGTWKRSTERSQRPLLAVWHFLNHEHTVNNQRHSLPLPLIDQCTLWILPIQVQLACVLYFCLNITCQTHTLTHSTDLSSLPKRKKPVYGVALLWQPEVMYVYLAVVEHYSGNVETVEAAAGAIQNLTSCGWKVSF